MLISNGISPLHTCNNMTTIIYLSCLTVIFARSLSVCKMKMIYFIFPFLFLNYKHVVINLWRHWTKGVRRGKVAEWAIH